MKRAKRLAWVILAIGCCLSAGCGRGREASPSDSSATNPASGLLSGHNKNQSSSENNQRAKDDVIAEMRKTLDASRSHQLKPPLPNFVAGPGLPHPLGLNFYEVNWHYPAYLQCLYDVSENHYDQSNEPAWFKGALLQIRGTGRVRFPPFKWVAVAIYNRAEHTHEQSFMVAAIFNIDEVFDRSHELGQLIARAEMDRHPYMEDPQQPTPGEQARWLIVERHAAAARPAAGSN